VGAGCRKGLEPNFDNDQAPETWITAAPADTITAKDNLGKPIPPVEGRLPYRYHLYWAGSDRDGAVVGYYWAVTETLSVPPAPGIPIPELPGPKARDYHFTRRTDSVFVFETSVDAPEREHGFYIYAVDDKGKVDPTPAKLIFRAYDRFPPIPVFDLAQASGRVYVAGAGGVTTKDTTYDIHQSFVAGTLANDVVPSGSQLTFSWHATLPLPTVVVTGYRYRMDEPNFNTVDATVHSVTYNTHVNGDIIAPGVKKFTLQALDQSGWHGDSTRYFQMNFEPDEWYSGPDTLDAFWTAYSDLNGKHYWYRDVTQWPTSAGLPFIFSPPAGDGIPGTMLSSDSANVLPALRPHRTTFFEIFGNRIWAHAEGDTVNLNSIVIFPTGGLDKDSPYAVKVGTSPGFPFPVGPVTTPGPPNGSPVGDRSLVVTRKLDQTLQIPTETTLFPIYDITSSYDLHQMNPRANMTVTGKAYAYAVAQDGDGAVDRRIDRASTGGAVRIIDWVDHDVVADPHAGSPSADMINLRSHVFTFYVNHKPYFRTGDGAFSPTPNQSFRRGASVQFNLLANDDDPIDYEADPIPPGGPYKTPVLVYTVKIEGLNQAGNDTTITVLSSVETGTASFTVPLDFQIGSATAIIDLCDYRPTDAALGNYGRCAQTLSVPIQISATAPAGASFSTTPGTTTTQRPGSPPADGRRQP
jgi:hypothetical protein